MRSSSHWREREVFRGRGGQLIEDERRRLGAVADDRIAFLEHPFGEAGRRKRPVADRRRGQQALQAAAGEEEHRPRGVGGRRRGEIARIAATLALVEVVRSIASKSRANRFILFTLSHLALPRGSDDAGSRPVRDRYRASGAA